MGDGVASAPRETQNPPSGAPVSQPAGLLGLESSLALPELVAERSNGDPCGGREGRLDTASYLLPVNIIWAQGGGLLSPQLV